LRKRNCVIYHNSYTSSTTTGRIVDCDIIGATKKFHILDILLAINRHYIPKLFTAELMVGIVDFTQFVVRLVGQPVFGKAQTVCMDPQAVETRVFSASVTRLVSGENAVLFVEQVIKSERGPDSSPPNVV
jgi:hypothetical protein